MEVGTYRLRCVLRVGDVGEGGGLAGEVDKIYGRDWRRVVGDGGSSIYNLDRSTRRLERVVCKPRGCRRDSRDSNGAMNKRTHKLAPSHNNVPYPGTS